MEPRIQYATTTDGVSIAFWTLGEGVPVVTILPWSHLELEWQDTDFRGWYERLAQTHRVIRYDGRGRGLSERNVVDFSLDAGLLDIEAVADRLGLEKFGLAGIAMGGVSAIAYAARHPERVSQLFLWCAHARAADVQVPPFDALAGLIDTNWQLFTETIAHAMVAGWEHPETARRFAAMMRESITPETFKAWREAGNVIDVSGLLTQIRAPTSVGHRRQVPWPPLDVARELASRILNARLTLLEGSSVLPFVGDMESVAKAIDEFLKETGTELVAAIAPRSAAGGLVTILFTDIQGSTALTQRLGDARAREVLREHERMVREALAAHGGSEVKTMGDGFMASFSSATRALECAIAMQRAFAAHNTSLPAHPEPVEGRAEPQPSAHGSTSSPRADRGAGSSPVAETIRVRIGLNAGEPIAEEADLFGTAVIMAERICGKASGGEILASNVVRELVAGKGFLFSDRGETVLRGFAEAVRLYEVRWREEEA